MDLSNYPPTPTKIERGFYFVHTRGASTYSLRIWEGAVRVGPDLIMFECLLASLSGEPYGVTRKNTAILSYYKDDQRLCEHAVCYWPPEGNLPPRDEISGEVMLLRLAPSLLEEVAKAAEKGEPLFDMGAMIMRP